ncbi:hypothetical protein [Sphingomonas mucosissima]|uniref:Uncharacterized protein n=1 Tax=Sphingomonas mucosissima TaxID=370959 RepID=A0A245ZPM6_9SPHN|nr:hypothetical protein [Sphingomonas mucosissima]OWK31690.1 hypothetical protein SPMU_00080 [Sphingomonas mucosissima]
MSMSDQEYCFMRAEAELKMAQRSQQPAAVQAHYTLAGYYLDRAYGEPHQPRPATNSIRQDVPPEKRQH